MFKILATTFSGLENVLVDELTVLGIKDPKQVRRGVIFTCGLEDLYRVNLWSRLALRFYKHILDFSIEKPNDIYDAASTFNWWKMIGVDETFRIDTNVFSDLFNNPIYAAHLLKDAIVDQFRSRFSRRPSVEKHNPDFSILLSVRREEGAIWLDSSGDTLFKRGYRVKSVKAPINEVLAAGIIALSGWESNKPLVDPMCGSGTIPVEAALMGMNIPPQFLRQHFNFMKWPDFDRFLWKKIKQNVMEQQSDIELQIVAADIDSSAVEATTFNIKNIRMHKDISIIHSDFFALKNPFENGFIISNPPYGERLDMNEPNAFYRKMGDQLKNNYSGYKACLFSANNQALKSIRLKPNRKIPLFNGALECRLFCYDLFDEGQE